jgi:hypothetical protein
MNQYKIRVPMADGEVFVIDLESNLDSPAVKQAIDLLNNVTLLHDSLKKLVKEMAPVAIISQSQDYKDAVLLLSILEPL